MFEEDTTAEADPLGSRGIIPIFWQGMVALLSRGISIAVSEARQHISEPI